MAKRKQKTELENKSNETSSIEQQEIIEDNKTNETTNEKTNETTNEKTTKKKNVDNTIKEKEYIITKKSDGVYIRKLRRL